MMAFVLIALIAGAASALMFASIVSGALISLVLRLLAPMPLMVAALVWGPPAALIGGFCAVLGLSLIADPMVLARFGVEVALPAWWLGHLTLLGRPFGTLEATSTPELEWYPLGRILIWAAAIAALMAFVGLLSQGNDAAAVAELQQRRFAALVELLVGQPVSANDPTVAAMVSLMPVLLAMSSFACLTINLWVASKVAETSGRLRRPWPDIKRTDLPIMTPVALCVAIAFCFSGGMVGLTAKAVTGGLLMAYALMGLAVMHTLTLALRSRTFFLGMAYALITVFTGVLFVLAIVGLADGLFGFRTRYLRTRQPPPLPTP